MPPSNLAEPGAFDEALEWFRDRLPMTDEAYQEASGRARRRAFWVAGAADLDTVHDVWDALDRAIAQGTTLEDFKKDVGDKLAKEWGRQDASRLETIFRTNLQTAYSTGRWHQENEPAVAKRRPYRQFVATLDTRTSDICRRLGSAGPDGRGIVLRADDPFWLSHYPPLHHQCRSITRLLRQSQAEELGIAEEGPELEPADGFGVPDTEWEPDLSAYPHELARALPKKPPR